MDNRTTQKAGPAPRSSLWQSLWPRKRPSPPKASARQAVEEREQPVLAGSPKPSTTPAAEAAPLLAPLPGADGGKRTPPMMKEGNTAVVSEGPAGEEKGSPEAATPPAGEDETVAEGGEAEGGDMDDLMSIFADEAKANEELALLAGGLQEVDVHWLVQQCRQVAGQLRGR